MSAHYDEDFRAIFGGHDRGDLAFFRALSDAADGAICEVGAGTGRVIAELARSADRGRRLVGVEPSAPMRRRFAERVAAEGLDVEVLAGSFEDLPLASGAMGVVYAAFRSFQHVLTTDAQLASLAEVRRVLRPGGVFACDLFDPAYALLRRARPRLGYTTTSARGTILERWESRRVDRVAQRVDATFRWVERDADGRVLRDESATYAIRYTFPIELAHLLARAGFVDVDIRGGYDGAPIGEAPRELVAVCRAP